MTAAPHVPDVLRVRCHYCSRFRSRSEVLRIGTGGAIMCWHCYEWHRKALQALAGAPPAGCQECGKSGRQMVEDADGAGNVRFFLHQKDGIYQILCKACSDAYERRRLDLYGDTLYGWWKKLKGAN